MSQKSSYKVAMVGATGAVGETLLAILAERDFPVSELVPLASERSRLGGYCDRWPGHHRAVAGYL